MFVLVTGEGGTVRATVEDAGNLRQLVAEFRGVDDAAAADALRVAGLGRLDGDVVWLDAAALRAAVDSAAGSPADFYGMLAYAKTRGEAYDDLSQVRARVIRS
jgi:hypothetical protein